MHLLLKGYCLELFSLTHGAVRQIPVRNLCIEASGVARELRLDTIFPVLFHELAFVCSLKFFPGRRSKLGGNQVLKIMVDKYAATETA